MYVGILSSSREEINDYYKSIASSVSNYLANDDYNLVFGGCSKSMMGACYKEFAKNNKEIIAFTTKKFVDDIENLDKANTVVCETTFDLKKEIYENSDVLLFLPGGVGTFSELFSFIEESRSNDRCVPIEIYDEDGYYLPFIEQLQMLVINNFADSSIFDYFKVSHNKEEFIEHMNIYKKGEMNYGK